jgi:hypothetical protein
LKHKRDEPISNLAFKFNLRHFNLVPLLGKSSAHDVDKMAQLAALGVEAGAYTRPPFSTT